MPKVATLPFGQPALATPQARGHVTCMIHYCGVALPTGDDGALRCGWRLAAEVMAMESGAPFETRGNAQNSSSLEPKIVCARAQGESSFARLRPGARRAGS